MINFWLQDGDRVSHWQRELQNAKATSLIVGRVANLTNLRTEFEQRFSES